MGFCRIPELLPTLQRAAGALGSLARAGRGMLSPSAFLPELLQSAAEAGGAGPAWDTLCTALSALCKSIKAFPSFALSVQLGLCSLEQFGSVLIFLMHLHQRS